VEEGQDEEWYWTTASGQHGRDSGAASAAASRKLEPIAVLLIERKRQRDLPVS